ncbi:aminoacyl-tRNA hydrolase [Pinibacter aurantiacus]|uniref:Peptidyl-tRNA hydrolase n=1 Tax=Pinibacter aurantiacus TaxID=2851599 RepID=A0A9E2SEQ1_9BACT|nr:aminoacyl-tRNA hydrolase [Pinibacter aurantiacus]MBV4360672.1 aminoacyl-tRNA hydrolase [Pinibacter aurantiacus]
MNKFLLIGLGNIGAEYELTRHNIGFDVLDTFAGKNAVSFKPDRLADVAEIRWKGKIFICVKPTTYMNLSGKAVKYWMDKEKIGIENILVIVDDLALPLEKVRLRRGGSDAGHNGLKSIQEHLGTDNFPKLRFGIGNNFPKGRQIDFVLGKWTSDEWPLVVKKVNSCVELIETYSQVGIEQTMNLYNKLTFSL